MDKDQCRQAAIDYFAKVNSRDLDGALAMLHDSATLWIPDRGTLDKKAIKELFSFAQGLFVGEPSFKVVGTTAEGNRVAVECEMGADLKNGKRYDNKYHVLFEFDEGKIKAMREYTDSAPAQAAFGS